MAIAIMRGLSAATGLTMLFVPALYAAWFEVARMTGPAPGGDAGARPLKRFNETVNCPARCVWRAGGRYEVIQDHSRPAPVRMDGECLLPAGGEPLHGPFHPDVCEAMRFSASHIKPIEDEA